MSGTGFKSFVCSFFLTLFALISANGIFFRVSKTSSSDMEIQPKNIMLFIKKDAVSAPFRSAAVNQNTLSDIISSSKNTPSLTNPQSDTPFDTDDFNSENHDDAHENVPPQEKSGMTIADASQTEAPKLPPLYDKEEEKAQEEQPSEIYKTHQEQTAKVVQQIKAIPSVDNKKEDFKLLIPIQHDGKRPIFANNRITVDGKQAHSQLAMANAKKVFGDLAEEEKTNIDTKAEKPHEEKEDSAPEKWTTLLKKGEPSPQGREILDIYDMEKADIAAAPEDSGNETSPTEQIAEDADKTASEGAASASLQDNTWLAAKGTNFPKNNSIKDADYFQNAEDGQKVSDILNGKPVAETKDHNVKVAGEVVKNILIPIPEDIMQDKDLTPQLVSDPKDKILEEELTEKEKFENFQGNSVTKDSEDPFLTETTQTATFGETQESKGLLKSLTSIFSSKTDSKGNGTSSKATSQGTSSADTDILPNGKILPSEIRLSFQPNRAEISGKTLKWIQAFGEKAKNDNVILEIRIDGTSSYALQQKRLNLLYNILTNLGLDYQKVSTVFTAREANSFILRVVKYKENNEVDASGVSRYYRRQ